MDIKKLKAEHPDVYQAVLDEGKAKGIEASKELHIAEGKAAGILAERNRIASIDALSLPRDFAAKAKSEDWTPEHAAIEYLRAEAEKRKSISAKMQADISQPLESNAPVEVEAPKAQKPDAKAEFEGKIAELTKAGMKRTEAMRAAAKANPELHQQWINAINGRAA